MADIMAEIRKLQTDKRLILGTTQTLKLLKQGKLAKVYLSSNCPDNIKEDLQKYCSLSGIDCLNVGMPNEELGTLCKKTFAISVIGVLKSA